jgi:hypothetical protein
MSYPIKIEELNSSVEFFEEVAGLVKESKDYLSSQKWCDDIMENIDDIKYEAAF